MIIILLWRIYSDYLLFYSRYWYFCVFSLSVLQKRLIILFFFPVSFLFHCFFLLFLFQISLISAHLLFPSFCLLALGFGLVFFVCFLRWKFELLIWDLSSSNHLVLYTSLYCFSCTSHILLCFIFILVHFKMFSNFSWDFLWFIAL